MLKGGFYFDEITGLNSTWIVKFVKSFLAFKKKKKKFEIDQYTATIIIVIVSSTRSSRTFSSSSLPGSRLTGVFLDRHTTFLLLLNAWKPQLFLFLTTIINIYRFYTPPKSVILHAGIQEFA